MASQIERILILAKTYPSPSAQHVETSCVAGINEHGAMRRLYPVPFRLIEEGQKFKKWQWIEVRVEKASKDHRAESHKLYVDTIICGDVIDTKKQWNARWPWIEKLPTFTNFYDAEASCAETGLSLALIDRHRCWRLKSSRRGTANGLMRSVRSYCATKCRGSFSAIQMSRKWHALCGKCHSTSTTDTSALHRRVRGSSSTKSSIGRQVFFTGTAARVTGWIGRSHFGPSSKRA